MTVTGIDHVQVAAPPGCEEAARAFYGELLGLDELPKPAELADRGGVWFASGDQGTPRAAGVGRGSARAAGRAARGLWPLGRARRATWRRASRPRARPVR